MTTLNSLPPELLEAVSLSVRAHQIVRLLRVSKYISASILVSRKLRIKVWLANPLDPESMSDDTAIYPPVNFPPKERDDEIRIPAALRRYPISEAKELVPGGLQDEMLLVRPSVRGGELWMDGMYAGGKGWGVEVWRCAVQAERV